jgi:hypothetical protein
MNVLMFILVAGCGGKRVVHVGGKRVVCMQVAIVKTLHALRILHDTASTVATIASPCHNFNEA